MTKIWKYLIKPDLNEISMPQSSIVIHVDMQDGYSCMWAMVDPSTPYIMVRFRVFGTGWLIPEYMKYIGSWQDGSYVWHLFQDITP